MKINWYPGHMHKTRKLISEAMAKVDVVLEVLDARLPQASGNPLLRSLRRGKPCIKLLAKEDLADPKITRVWLQTLEKEKGVKALAIDARNARHAVKICKLCRTMAPHRGSGGRPIRVMVVGIPNVGKSTIINLLVGRKVAQVGNKPAVTKIPQLVDLKNGIVVNDTPGLLWPNLEDQNGAYCLAASGAVGENAMDYLEVGLFAVDYLRNQYPTLLTSRYGSVDLAAAPDQLLEQIGRIRGCLISGGEVDQRKTAELLLRELRGGKIGRISLEIPGEKRLGSTPPQSSAEVPWGEGKGHNDTA